MSFSAERVKLSVSLNRFLHAQELVFLKALTELQAGRKSSHWMWIIFPQLKGLGSSLTAEYYGINGLAEAQAYVSDPILGTRLIRCVTALMAHAGKPLEEIFAYPDNLKFCSSMTLFNKVAGTDSIFQDAMDAFCIEADSRTLQMLEDAAGE